MSTNQIESPLRRIPKLEPSVTGSLTDLPAYALFHWAERIRFTGKLIFDVEERLEELPFLNGVIQGTTQAELRERLLSCIGLFEGRYTLHEMPVHPPGVGLPPTQFFSVVEKWLRQAEVERSESSGNSLPSRGSFGSITPWEVLVGTTYRNFSGRLLLESERQRTLINYRNGRLTSVSSTNSAETLAAVLRRWEYLPAGQIYELESKAREDNIRFRDLIRMEGLLTEESLREALTTLHYERVLRVMSWRSGTYLLREDLSDALLRLVEKDRDKSLLLAVPDVPLDLLPWAQEMVAVWGEARHPAILVTVGLEPARAFDPSKGDVSDDWTTHLENIVQPIAAWLPLATETPSWRTADGTANVRRLMTRLHSKFDRILWLVSPPSKGSPLLSVSNHAVLVVQGGKSKTGDVSKIMADFKGQEWAGFIFREPATNESPLRLSWTQIGSMASPMVKSMTKVRDFLADQGRRIPRLARKLKAGSSAARE